MEFKYLMIYELYKYSTPGWTKQFTSEYDARQELLKYICYDCREGRHTMIGYDDEDDVWYDDEPPDVNNIYEMLSTACGCEFGYEEIGA